MATADVFLAHVISCRAGSCGFARAAGPLQQTRDNFPASRTAKSAYRPAVLSSDKIRAQLATSPQVGWPRHPRPATNSASPTRYVSNSAILAALISAGDRPRQQTSCLFQSCADRTRLG